jgi:hypothetical protein
MLVMFLRIFCLLVDTTSAEMIGFILSKYRHEILGYILYIRE